MPRRLEAFRVSIGAAAAFVALLLPGREDAALGQGTSTFIQPTVTADYLRALRQQAQEYDEARNKSTDPKEEVSKRASGRAEDYARSLFDFSRTEASQPRQYTTYDEITRPSLFPGATREPEIPLYETTYEDYYAASRRNDPRSSGADLAVSQSTFNPYEDFQQQQDANLDRLEILQAGASAGRFGAQTLELSANLLRGGRLGFEQAPYDNLNLGLVQDRMGAIAGLTYTDNATFQNGSEQVSDLIGQVAVRVATRQQITKNNFLNFRIGVGYSEYLLNPELNELIQSSGLAVDISPDSRLSWDTSLGNIFFTFFENFGLAPQVDDRFLAQQTDFQNFTNTIGSAVSWQANRTTSYTAALSRSDRKALDPEFSSNDTVTYNFIGDIIHSPGQEWIAGRNQIWTPTDAESWVAGLSSTVSRNERPEAIDGDTSSTTVAIGPHFTTPISEFTRIRIGTGWQFAKFIDPASGDSNFDEPFYSVDITNRLNRFTNQALRFGHESGLNDVTNGFVADFIRHSFEFNISPRSDLTVTAYSEHQEDRFGETQEILERTGMVFNLRHRLNSQVTLFLGYNYAESVSELLSGTAGTIRDPNDPTVIRNSPGNSLTQEIFTFDIAFPFAREVDLVLGYRRLKSLSSDPSGNFVENRGSINFSYNF